MVGRKHTTPQRQVGWPVLRIGASLCCSPDRPGGNLPCCPYAAGPPRVTAAPVRSSGWMVDHLPLLAPTDQPSILPAPRFIPAMPGPGTDPMGGWLMLPINPGLPAPCPVTLARSNLTRTHHD